MTYVSRITEHRKNIHPLRLAQFLSNQKGKRFQTCYIFAYGDDLMKAATYIGTRHIEHRKIYVICV